MYGAGPRLSTPAKVYRLQTVLLLVRRYAWELTSGGTAPYKEKLALQLSYSPIRVLQIDVVLTSALKHRYTKIYASS